MVVISSRSLQANVVSINAKIAEEALDRRRNELKISPADTSARSVRRMKRFLKVSSTQGGRPRFAPYYGLTFISLLPAETQRQLHIRTRQLERALQDAGYVDDFVFVPSDSYHVTFMSVIERIVPDIEQEEVDFYHHSVVDGLPAQAMSDLPCPLSVSRFAMYPNLTLYARAQADHLPRRVIQGLSSRLGSRVNPGPGGLPYFHVTLAYFAKELSGPTLCAIRGVVRESSLRAFVDPVKFEIDDACMCYFQQMGEFLPILGLLCALG